MFTGKVVGLHLLLDVRLAMKITYVDGAESRLPPK